MIQKKNFTFFEKKLPQRLHNYFNRHTFASLLRQTGSGQHYSTQLESIFDGEKINASLAQLVRASDC